MDSDPKCHDDGLLVGTQYPLPTDGREYYRKPGPPFVGCNRMFCPRCKEFVRHFDDHKLTRDLLSGDEYIQMWGATTPSQVPHLKPAPSPDERFYYCRCFYSGTSGASPARRLDDTDWACAGHPQGP